MEESTELVGKELHCEMIPTSSFNSGDMTSTHSLRLLRYTVLSMLCSQVLRNFYLAYAAKCHINYSSSDSLKLLKKYKKTAQILFTFPCVLFLL